MNTVFIIGVNHCWQELAGLSIAAPSVEDPRNGLRPIAEAEFAKFDEFIGDTIQQYGIQTIVEEACGHPHLRMRRLSEEVRLEHRYCELSKAQRERRGIKTVADRENYWISVLASVKQFPVLMICGAKHVESFNRLLRESGYETAIVTRDYEESLFPK